MEVSGRKDDNKDFTASVLLASDDGDQLVCLPCKQFGSYAKAFGYCQNCSEHLCETCYKSHRKPAPCRNHVLLDTAQMPKSPCRNTSSLDLTETCNRHRGQVIEYFCKDHQIVGCSPCITMDHRNCKINYIPDISQSYSSSPEYKNILQSFSRLNEKLNHISLSARKNKALIDTNRSKVKADVQTFRQDINAILDEWETSLVSYIDNVFSSEVQRADLALAKCEEAIELTETKKKPLNELERDDKCNMLFVFGKQYDELITKEMNVAEILEREIEINVYTFESNVSIRNFLMRETSLGTLSNTRLRPRTQEIEERLKDNSKDMYIDQQMQIKRKQPEVPKPESSVIFLENIAVQGDTTKSLDCKITGMAIIDTNEHVAVADFPNTCVRIIDVQGKKVISELKLTSRPWDVEVLPRNQIAVTLPNENMIQIISVSCNTLKFVKELTTDDSCYEIAFLEGTLIVSERYGLLKQVTLSGEIVDRLGIHGGYSDKSVAVCRTKGLIYAFNGDDIMCFKMSGEVVRKYNHKGSLDPCGLAVLSDGSILVCDEKERNVHHFSADLKSSSIILHEEDKFMFPCSIAVDHDREKLYLGSRFGCNYIKVYQLKLH